MYSSSSSPAHVAQGTSPRQAVNHASKSLKSLSAAAAGTASAGDATTDEQLTPAVFIAGDCEVVAALGEHAVVRAETQEAGDDGHVVLCLFCFYAYCFDGKKDKSTDCPRAAPVPPAAPVETRPHRSGPLKEKTQVTLRLDTELM